MTRFVKSGSIRFIGIRGIGTQERYRPKKPIYLILTIMPLLILLACANESQDAAVVGVEFEWQPIDFGSSENPEIRLLEVPEGTRRFFVGLVDLDVSTYDHGGGFAVKDGSGIIARGAVKGNYIKAQRHSCGRWFTIMRSP